MKQLDFELAKYKGRWSVFDRVSRTFSFIGKGKRFCKRKVMSLNNELDSNEEN